MAEIVGRTRSWLMWLAGSLLAFVFGGSGCGRSEPPVVKYGAPPMPPMMPADEKANAAQPGLEETAEWKQLSAAWKEAEEVASGSRGEYPFDREGKKKLLADLDRAAADLDKLVAAGSLSVAEAELLKGQKAVLAARVARFRPKEMEGATCYEAMALPAPAAESAGRLAERLPLLEKLAAGGKLQPVATEKVLAAIDGDLAVLADEKELARLPADERAKAEATREAVRLQVAKLRVLLKAGAGPAEGPQQPMCYDRMEIPEPKPQSLEELRARQAMIETLERAGRLEKTAADKARGAIADEIERRGLT